MVTALHGSQQIADGIHGILALGAYATEAARLTAGAALASTDVGKTALQSDVNSVWVYVSASPALWRRIGGAPPLHVAAGTTYTPAIADADAIVQTSNAGAVTITIPLNATVAYQVGDSILFEQGGAGQITLVGAGGVTLRSSGTLLSKGQYAVLGATYLGADTWLITGDRA